MSEVTIKHLSFRYTDAEGNEKTALQGTTVDIPAAEVKRGQEIGAFADEKNEAAPAAEFDVSSASDDELAAWVEESKPTVAEILEAAGDDPEVAQRLLAAENAATGDDPRKGVVEGLAAIAGRVQ